MDDIEVHMSTWQLAMDDIEAGNYESSLKGFVALQSLDSCNDRMLRNLQHNHALAGWGLLAQKYAPALDALKALLTKRKEELSASPDSTILAAHISEVERHISKASRSE